MSNTSIDLKTKLITAFQLFEGNLNGAANSAVHTVRKAAMHTFEQMGFPTTKHEEWKYSNVKDIINQDFKFNASTNFSASDIENLPIPNLEGNIIYVVNGVYNKDLSSIVSDTLEVQIQSFEEADFQHNELFENYFNKYSDGAVNAFTALNTAFAQNGLLINVPKGKVVAQPIIIRYINDARFENVASQPRNLIIVGENADVQIAESYRSIGENKVFTNAFTEIYVAVSANVHYYKIQNDTDLSYHVGTTSVLQQGKSVFTANTITANGGFVRNNMHIKIDGEHAEANMLGLYIPNNNQHVDNHTVVDHAKPNCESHELYKGILKDRSTGVFNGKIFVREDAQKTNAFQSCKNVLASPNATMNTKPQLEIWADDVKCSHGTTTGQLNDDALFYMQARGISKPVAKSLLMLAFAQEVIDKMEIPAIKAYLQVLIEEKISNS